MKLNQQLESDANRLNALWRTIACLGAALIVTIQLGCSATGSSPTHQAFSPPTNFGNPQGTFQGQGQFYQGGSGTSFQANPNGQFYQGGSGTSFQPNPGQYNSGGSGTSFQSNPGSGSRGFFGVGYQRPLSEFQSGFNPFAPPKTTC